MAKTTSFRRTGSAAHVGHSSSASPRVLAGAMSKGKLVKVRRVKAAHAVVTLPRDEYDALIRRIEDLEDLHAIEEAEADPDREVLPVEMVRRLLAGEESKVRIWREHRGLSGGELARRAEIAPSYLSEIETGKKPGSVKAMAALARALNVDIEALID